MISDDPDEDADALEDDVFLDSLYDRDSPKPDARADRATDLPMWPPRRLPDGGVTLDRATLAWFKANHADWRAEIAVVLRSWAALHAPAPPDIGPADFLPPHSRALG